MNIYNTAIIGCGKVGDFHASAYAGLPQSNLRAVCSKYMADAQRLAEKYHVKAYDNVSAMIRECEIDIVSVCTPHPVHVESAVAAADCGAHVICEKPLASSVKDCDAILQAGERNHIQIGTIVQRRFYRPCMRMHEAIESGKIGRPILGTIYMHGWRDEAYYRSDPWRGTWNGEGGGVLASQSSHQLDLLLWYMGEAQEVYGVWKNYNHPYIEVDDTVVAIVKFKNGGIGNIVVSNSQNPALYGKVHIFGDNGASIGVQTDGGAMFIAGISEITEPPFNDLWTIPGESEMLESWKKEDYTFFESVDFTHYYHKVQIEDFIRAVDTGTRPISDGHEGKKVVDLFQAIYLSSNENRVIKLPL